jgi:site-specific recombinase XerD
MITYDECLRDAQAWLRSQGTTLERAGLDELTAWVRTVSAGGLADVETARIVGTLRSYLTTHGRADLASRMGMPRNIGRYPVVPSREEIGRLLSAATPDQRNGLRDRAIMELMYATGIRADELRNLIISDVQTFGLLVRRGKGGKDRVIPVGQPARTAVAAYLVTRPNAGATDWLFLSAQGNPFDSSMFYTMLQRWAAVSAQRVFVHPGMLRQAFAAHLLHAGANLREVRQFLGHNRLATTALYLHMKVSDMESRCWRRSA